MKNNYLTYIMIAAAIAQAIEQQQAVGGSNTNKRANAIKTVLTAVTPLLHGSQATPELAEHIGLLIDDFIALNKKMPKIPPAEPAPAPPTA